MFWTKVSKALSDIIMVVSFVMALMLAEGFGKMLDSVAAGVLGFALGLIISIGAGVAMKTLIRTSESLINMLNKLEGNELSGKVPQSLEDIEEYEKEINQAKNSDDSELVRESGQEYVNKKWKNLAPEIKLVWADVLGMLAGTVYLAYRASEYTQYGAMLILGFGLVVNMIINAIIGTAVENHHKVERVNYLMRTRNIRKRESMEE